jgi:hypothetical protein
MVLQLMHAYILLQVPAVFPPPDLNIAEITFVRQKHPEGVFFILYRATGHVFFYKMQLKELFFIQWNGI